MKRILFAAVLLVTTLLLKGQLRTSVVLQPNPPASLPEWYNKKEIFTFIVNNLGAAAPRAVIKAEIINAAGEQVAVTNLTTAPVYTFASPTTIMDAKQVLGMEYIMFRGTYAAGLNRTGVLPAESYQLCLQLVTPVDFRPISEIICRNFTLASYQPPYPMMPAEDVMLDANRAQQAIIFRWSPVSPKPNQPVTYELVVTEVLQHQTPMQAFRSNQPLLLQQVTGTTQFIWTPQFDFKTDCCNNSPADSLYYTSEGNANNQKVIKRLVWGVRARDAQGRIIGTGDDAAADGFKEIREIKIRDVKLTKSTFNNLRI